MRRVVRTMVPLCAVALVVTGCSGDEPAPRASPSAIPAVSDTASAPGQTAVEVPVRDTLSLIATSKESTIDVYPNPNEAEFDVVDAEDVLTVPGETPLVFLVKTQTDGWLEVWLPVRPNGSTGWIREDDVTLSETRYWMDVDLDGFSLAVYDDDDMLFETAIGVGQDDMPTPGGTYYIRELLQPPDPTGVYGPFAYGLSGFSPVLDSFKGGDAVIGIHGTDDPSSIGGMVSHGCIRMSNDSITKIATTIGLPLGTPIYINT
jgi:lipoprotein-anchoring transpeptidase ErfK/SrfK